jgi:FAD synthetase
MGRRRVVVAGTFDILHPGHVFLISEAVKLGDVIVVVARDKNVQRAKGHRVIVPERQRRFMVEALKGVTQAVLGSEDEDLFRVIEQLNPDILLLGPNQQISTEQVERELQRRKLKAKVQRLESLFEGFPLSSTSAIVDKVLATRQSER